MNDSRLAYFFTVGMMSIMIVLAIAMTLHDDFVQSANQTNNTHDTTSFGVIRCVSCSYVSPIEDRIACLNKCGK